MQELKFRVWYISYKQFLIPHQEGNEIQPWISISFSGEIMHGDNQGSFVDSNQEDYIIQQFTGIHDYNNNSIYEGDIVEFTEKMCELGDAQVLRGVVVYDDCFGAYGLAKDLESDCFNYFWENTVSHTKVIGNIFETPHLLNENKGV